VLFAAFMAAQSALKRRELSNLFFRGSLATTGSREDFLDKTALQCALSTNFWARFLLQSPEARFGNAMTTGAPCISVERQQRVLVLGNLQSGKTSLLRRLSGERSTYMGIPGSSHELEVFPMALRRRLSLRDWLKERFHLGRTAAPFLLIDTPGTTTLLPQGEDEDVARDALLRLCPDVLLVVADAKSLRRSLAIVAHAAEFGLPMVLALNMMDEARQRGIEVDVTLLATHLGIEVVPTSATDDEGIGELAAALTRARLPQRLDIFSKGVERALDELKPLLEPLGPQGRGVALLALTQDPVALRHVAKMLGPQTVAVVSNVIEQARHSLSPSIEAYLNESLFRAAARLASKVVATRTAGKGRALDVLGRAAYHPVWGVLLAMAMVVALYYWVGVLGATIVVDALDAQVFQKWLVPLVEAWTKSVPIAIVRDALVDPDFGLVPTGLFLAFGLVMPVLFFFYTAFGVLSDSGYLPRLSVLSDVLLRRIGLNGRAILPLAMGMSCVTMALLTTRMLSTRKERIIASFLLMLGMPCAPLLSVMFVVLGRMPVSASITVFGVLALQIVLAGALAARVLPGSPGDFIIEIPPLRAPSARRVLGTAVRQTFRFMKEAVPFFLAASLALFVFQRIGGLAALEHAARPLVGGWLGLPDESVQVFVKTFVRREAGAAELNLLAPRFTNLQVVVTLLVMTFLTPCANALIVLFKERGAKVASAIVAAVFLYALFTGIAVSAVCRWLGIDFT
jgi:ferrous iron transport protein B